MVTAQGLSTVFRFLSPYAHAVFLVGDFNHWAAADLPMKRSADGFWSATLDLPPGEYAVTITLTNNQAEGREPGTDDKNPVKLWQGTVTSPTIKVTVPKKERPTSRAAAQAQVSHFPLPSVGTGREYQPPGRSMTLATGEPRAASFRPMFPTLSP
jgi:hypothetical protein